MITLLIQPTCRMSFETFHYIIYSRLYRLVSKYTLSPRQSFNYHTGGLTPYYHCYYMPLTIVQVTW